MWLRAPGPLVPWSSGPLVPWSPAPLLLWFPDPLVPWSSGLSILWSLVAAFGRLEILPITGFGASIKMGRVQVKIFEVLEILRLVRNQETANKVFAALERLRVLQITASGAFGK